MNATAPDAKAIFLLALDKESPEDRSKYLDESCGGNAELRQRVEQLLHAHEQAGKFLGGPAAPEATSDQPPGQRIGTQIGPYKLLQQIGEGGFGVVYMAEQVEPVRRKVALKLIKPGMDTRQVMARFEAERQALALMDHPNIAKVLDAGTVGKGFASHSLELQVDNLLHSGRPYFVMELVRGIPITQYCDENQLPIRERLELFATVCQAIQHAHTKGIIHRDIKPTNVLVTQQDGQPLVKVIDFGIAKAMGQQLTEKTLFTEFAQMIGTPQYMSPEQAAMSSVDIDTRSDIYSLGVLLYELLTGTTPVSKEQLKQAAFDEIRRIIREDEPQKPSTRISTAEAAPSIAAQRHTEPAKLTKLVRGELDWIVMKALEKDRSRRFETASGFAKDVQHYLADEPVQACPPSAAYRLRKFVRRNTRGLATAGFIALALLGTLVTLAVSNVVISQERDAKTIALEERQAALIQAQANKEAADKQRQRAEDNLQLAVNALDQILLKPAEKRLEISRRERGLLLATDPERQQLESELLEKGAEFYAQFAKHNSADPAAQLNAATAYHWLGYYQHQLGHQEKSLQAYRHGLRFLEGSTLASQQEDPAYMQSQAELYHSMYLPLFAMKQYAEAEEVTRRGLAAFEKLAVADRSGRAHGCWRQLIWSNMNLGSLASQGGRKPEAEQAFLKALAVSDDALQAVPENVELRRDKAIAGELLGAFYANADRLDEAIAVWGAVTKECAKLAQDTGEARFRWREAGALEHVGHLHQKASRYQDAEKQYAEALIIWEELVTETNHPDYRFHLGSNREHAGYVFKKMGRLNEAAAAYQAAITIWDKLIVEFNQPGHRGHLAGCQSALEEVRNLQENQSNDLGN